jgi:8-oxo-dGTP pyrophosphatase MutT (NUDIX family)/phosphohistidine phosphatase SixA
VPVLRAAGGVLWDVHDGILRIAIIRRPRYDDWSLPKGKLLSGEHVLLAAVREVVEETGYSCTLGRPLGDVQYMKQTSSGPTPKTVQYWACRATSGRFTAGDEVDELLWLRPKDAARLATLDRDRDVIARFGTRPVDTVPFILLRHGSAGQRGSWPGDDRERPLDEVGQRQADAMVDLLDCFGVQRVLSADVVRCVDTVRPYAVKHGLTVESEPLLSETGFPANPKAAMRRIATLVSEGRPTVLCSQGGVMSDLVTALCQTYGHKVPSDPSARKGTFWAMHLAGDEMVGLDKHTALS